MIRMHRFVVGVVRGGSVAVGSRRGREQGEPLQGGRQARSDVQRVGGGAVVGWSGDIGCHSRRGQWEAFVLEQRYGLEGFEISGSSLGMGALGQQALEAIPVIRHSQVDQLVVQEMVQHPGRVPH